MGRQAGLTKRITNTAGFTMDGAEFDLYEAITRFVKRQSTRAAAQSDDPRHEPLASSCLYTKRRLASSAHAMLRSLENRAIDWKLVSSKPRLGGDSPA